MSDHGVEVPLHGELGRAGHLDDQLFPEVGLCQAVDGHRALNRDKVVAACDSLGVHIEEGLGLIQRIASDSILALNLQQLLRVA